MKKNTSGRYRYWFLVSYLPIDVIEKRCQSVKNIRNYAIIEHDRDLFDDGTFKDKHCHILLYLYQARTLSQITAHFVDNSLNAGNCFGEVARNMNKCFRYLTHQDEPDKTQYREIDIVCNDFDYFTCNDISTSNDNTFDIVTDLANGVQFFDMVKRYGKDFLYHYSQIKDFMLDCGYYFSVGTFKAPIKNEQMPF